MVRYLAERRFIAPEKTEAIGIYVDSKKHKEVPKK